MTFICPICDNNEYEETDGLYYCTLCCTQSQELISQEVEQSFDEGLAGKLFLTEVKTKTNQKQRKRDDYGRPWTIYEAYQHIIMAQADAFINLGMSPDLQEIIFSLWANYLSKLGVAFCRVEKVVPDIVVTAKCGRQRELHRGNFANPINRNKRPLEDPEGSASAKRLKLSETSQEGEQEGEVNEEENMKAPSDVEKVPDLKPSPRDTSNIIFVDESLGNKSLYKMAVKSPEWMDLKKTIAISYLGVLLTNPQIIAADVVRWIYDGKIPFLSTTHLLPEDMVMSGTDAKLFGTVTIDSEQLIQSVNKMKTFLDIKKMSDASIPSLIKRFLKELDLPDKLYTVCMELRRKAVYSLTAYKTRYKKAEIPALLYIGLALKLLFGLDGTTERKLSSYSIKVRNLLKSDTKIFVFDEWKAHQVKKQYHEFDAYSELTQSLSPSLHTKNPDMLLESYSNLQRDEIHFCWNEDYTPVSKKQEFRNILRHPLSLAVAQQENRAKQTKRSEHDIETVGGHLRQSCLMHISDFSRFKQYCHKNVAEEDLDGLEREIKEILSNFTYTGFAVEDDEDVLLVSRPRNFIWLLKIFSRIADCSVLVFDQGLIKMQEQIKKSVWGKKSRLR